LRLIDCCCFCYELALKNRRNILSSLGSVGS
jgi:hypothetical protein